MLNKSAQVRPSLFILQAQGTMPMHQMTRPTATAAGNKRRGPLNMRNVIPLKFIFSEPEKYGPLLKGMPAGEQLGAAGGMRHTP